MLCEINSDATKSFFAHTLIELERVLTVIIVFECFIAVTSSSMRIIDYFRRYIATRSSLLSN